MTDYELLETRLMRGNARYSFNAEFKEEDHPRGEDGKFGTGGKGAEEKEEDMSSEELSQQKKQKKQEQTKEFKEWFSGSEITNKDGSPKIVWHGTNKEFDVFDKSKLGQATDSDDPAFGATARVGFWFNDDKVGGKNYDKYMPCYLSIKNPVHYNTNSDLAEELRPYIDKWQDPDYHGTFNELVEEWWNDTFYDNVDGIVIDDDEEFGGTSYIARDPKQIKSATKNNGDFDPKSDKITNSSSIRVYRAPR